MDSAEKELEAARLASEHADKENTHDAHAKALAHGKAAAELAPPPPEKKKGKGATKGDKLKAFAAGDHEAKPHALKRGKKGGTYYESAGGKKVYTKG